MPNDLAKVLDGVTDDNNFQTEILVVTLEDNLSHPYFEDIKINKDNINPIGNAVLTTLYTGSILEYWASYSGIVVVSVRMLDSNRDNTNSANYFDKTIRPEFTRYQQLIEKKNQEKGLDKFTDKEKVVKQVLQNDYYNYSFIGKVSRFKQQGKKYILYLEDLGWKFMQKVPMEFRKTFIAGQYLDDAFQAICEFMGVEFAYSIEDLHEYNFGADGYSIEKDGQVIEDVPQILREWANGTEEETEELEEGDDVSKGLEKELKKELYDATGSNSGLIEYNKKNNIVNKDKKDDTSKDNTDSNTNSEEEDDKQSLEDKINEFQEEFDEKVKNLFIGNTFYDSDLCNPILSYDKITIEPKAVADSSNMSATGGGGGNTSGGSSTPSLYETTKSQVQNSEIGLKANITRDNRTNNLQRGKDLIGRSF